MPPKRAKRPRVDGEDAQANNTQLDVPTPTSHVDTPSVNRAVRLEIYLRRPEKSTRTQSYLAENVVRRIGRFDPLWKQVKSDDCGMVKLLDLDTVCNKELFEKSIAFLHTGHLTPFAVDGSRRVLHEHVDLYNFSLEMSIPDLEYAIIQHFKAFRGFSLTLLIYIASEYFHGANTRNSSLGRYFKETLEQFWPEISTLDEYNREKLRTGNLGRVYMEVLEERCAAADAKTEGLGSVKLEAN